jgi:hypothetical protein
MYVTDGSLPQNNLMPPPPEQVARCKAKMYRLGLAVQNARANTATLLPPPETFSDVVGPSVVQEIANQQKRLRVSQSFLGGRPAMPSVISSGPSVSVTPSMYVNNTILDPGCPLSYRERSQSAPRLGDAISTNCGQVPSGWPGFVQSHPWLSALLVVAGGAGLIAAGRKRR